MMTTTYISYQQDIENDKVEEIVENMKTNGWQGMPIVVWGDTLITGNHRYAACEVLDLDPETITLEEIFEIDGLDFEEEHANADYPCSSDSLGYFLNVLSDETIEAYGIQF